LRFREFYPRKDLALFPCQGEDVISFKPATAGSTPDKIAEIFK